MAQSNPIQAVILLFVVALLAGTLLTVGITSMFAANTTTWDAATVAIFIVLPIIILIGVFISILKSVGMKI